ncbi:MAG: hypothetical protein OSB58_04085 [Alphaproteobacteria bacterium]|nr:hypothetical protein [Alphaproteobacteria bacterium]
MTRMKTALLAGATSIALALTFNSPAMAGTEVIKGLSCLTGKLDMLATTKKDLGWAWSSNFTWYAKDNPKRNVAGKCVGSGGLTGGKYETAPFRCKVLTADGSTYMTKGTANRKSMKGIIYGGTGSFKGVSGTISGGAPVKLPAEKGMFAACREEEGTWIMPD